MKEADIYRFFFYRIFNVALISFFPIIALSLRGMSFLPTYLVLPKAEESL